MDVILSSYNFAPPYGATVVPIAHYQPLQSLFGVPSQVRAVARTLGRVSDLHYCYFPEMLSPSPFTREVQSAVLGTNTTATVHIRVGSRRRARVIKGCRNILVTSDEETRLPPDGLDTYLAGTLISRTNALFEECFFLRPSPGEALSGFTKAAASELSDTKSPDQSDERQAPLLIASFADLATSSSDQHLHSPSLWQSSSVYCETLKEAEADGRPILLIPFNLDHDQSTVPALLRLLARASKHASTLAHIVVFPFNDGPLSRQLLVHLAQECLKLEEAGVTPSSFWCAVAPTISSLKTARHLFSCAVLDASDYDFSWSHLRLSAVEIPILTVGDITDQGPQPDIPLHGQPEQVLLDDELGARRVRRAVPTMADVRKLITLVHARHPLVRSSPDRHRVDEPWLAQARQIAG